MRHINEPGRALRLESRWPPALATLVVLVLLAVLPHHVQALPVWFHYLAAIAVLVPMAGLALSPSKLVWLRIEHAVIPPVVVIGAAVTVATLAKIIEVIVRDMPGGGGIPLLSSSVALWASNILLFSLLYWQVDHGGPHARASATGVRSEWVFAQPATPEDLPSDWRPLFVDYLALAYWTAAAFSPTDTSPLTRRAKLLMMAESIISLLTMVVVVSRAINVLK